MDFGSPEFVLAIIAIGTFGWLASSWIRVRHRYPLGNEWSGTTGREEPEAGRRIEALTTENGALKANVARLEERIAVLERIATDPAERTAREIENLR